MLDFFLDFDFFFFQGDQVWKVLLQFSQGGICMKKLK